MSKKRVITIRQSDEMIVEAFEIALAQLGVYKNHHRRLYSYITIEGNKSEGMVTVKAGGVHEATVYTRGEGEIFTYVDHITFYMINGVKLEQSKSVQIQNFDSRETGSNLCSVLTRYTENRETQIYQVVGMLFGFNLVESVLYYLWKYPRVELGEYEGEYILVYEFPEEICMVKKVTLTYNKVYGYVEAVVNGNHYFLCDRMTNVWKEHVGSKS